MILFNYIRSKQFQADWKNTVSLSHNAMFLATSNLSVHTEHKTADATQSQQIRRYLMFNAMKSRILEQIRCHSGWGLIIRLSSELTIWQIDVNLNLEYIYCQSLSLKTAFLSISDCYLDSNSGIELESKTNLNSENSNRKFKLNFNPDRNTI